MNSFLTGMFQYVLPAVVLFLQYRFLCRMLGNKYPKLVTFLALQLFGLVYGQINLHFQIAGTISGNTLYFCIGDFFIVSLLFRRSVLERLCAVALIECCSMVVSYIWFPLDYAYISAVDGFSKAGTIANLSFSLISLISTGLVLEYAGRKFEKLRNGLPTAYAVHFLLVSVLTFIASVCITELSMFVYEKATIPTAMVCSACALAGTAAIAFSISSIDRQITMELTQQRYALESAHFLQREEDWMRLERLRHDIKNHLLCLEGLLRDGKTEEAASYLQTLAQAAIPENRISTGNAFADVIINEKCAVAEKNGIRFSAEFSVPGQCRIDPVDFCCVLGNVLDNAIEACGHIDPSLPKWIEAKSFVRQAQLVLEVKNSVAAQTPSPENRPLSTRSGRGIGLGTVRRIVEQYGGAMDCSLSHCFVFRAMFPLK